MVADLLSAHLLGDCMNCANHPEYPAWWQVNGIGFCQHCKESAKAAQKVACELADMRRRKGLCIGCGKPKKSKEKICPHCGRGAGVDFGRRTELKEK